MTAERCMDKQGLSIKNVKQCNTFNKLCTALIIGTDTTIGITRKKNDYIYIYIVRQKI